MVIIEYARDRERQYPRNYTPSNKELSLVHNILLFFVIADFFLRIVIDGYPLFTQENEEESLSLFNHTIHNLHKSNYIYHNYPCICPKN